MELLIQWVTQIIIFLLLASIIDLIIPETTMKKYIKLVVGLILILIFLRPIFFLFTVDIEQSLEDSFNAFYEESTDHSLENLIKIQKEDIQASKDAYILEQMSNQLKDIADNQLLEQFKVEITSIDFQFSSEEVSYESLEEVIVLVEEATTEKGVVNIIDDVQINLDNELVDQEAKQGTEQIKEMLIEIWELQDKDLTVKWGEGRVER